MLVRVPSHVASTVSLESMPQVSIATGGSPGVFGVFLGFDPMFYLRPVSGPTIQQAHFHLGHRIEIDVLQETRKYPS
jgi:hypothetical protein